jgi:hypothetical protein
MLLRSGRRNEWKIGRLQPFDYPRKNCCFAVRNAEKVGGLTGVSRLLSTLLKSGSNLSPQLPPHRSLCLKMPLTFRLLGPIS